jgi:hypothetical protein
MSLAKVDYIIDYIKICFLCIKCVSYLHLRSLPKPSKHLHHVVCEHIHDPGQKSCGGEGSKEIFFFFLGGGVIKFHEILQQICENLEGWSINFQK